MQPDNSEPAVHSVHSTKTDNSALSSNIPDIPDGRPWLLLVDDDERNLHSTKRILQDMDIHIQTAISGEDALRAILKREFFLVLMDVQMPGMDGFEAASYIRNSENYKNIPIIFMTAISKDEKYIGAGYNVGAVDYLFKPINPHTLMCKLQNFLDLHQVKVEMERKNAELRIYDHMVAHDLKAPIRGIKFCLSALRDDLESVLTEDTSELLTQAEKKVHQAQELVQSILRFSEAQKSEGLMQSMTVAECVDAALLNLDVMIVEKKVEILTENFDHLIEAVPIKAQQLFQNLIGNAIKYQKDGSIPKIRIYSRQIAEQSCQQVCIEDNGIGFSQDKAEAIFTPFKRLHGTGRYEGSGIGLATCKRICEFHGWGIRAESAEGEGATFIVTMPLEKKG
ncbi:MAG: response regulator [Planctomycetes bacterium]|nr:response regulator [Planctomycetota bacterium]